MPRKATSVRLWGRRPFVALSVLPFVGVGAYGLFWSTSQIALDRRSRHWPSTLGVIIRSQVEETHAKKTSYWPNVEYKYTVGNQSYSNSVIQFGQNGSAQLEDAKATVAKYNSSSDVKVYYQPGTPQVSCLQPGHLYRETYFAIPLSLFLLGFGLWLGQFLLAKGNFIPK